MKIDYNTYTTIIIGILLILLSIGLFNYFKIIQIPTFPLNITILLVFVFDVGVMAKKYWID